MVGRVIHSRSNNRRVCMGRLDQGWRNINTSNFGDRKNGNFWRIYDRWKNFNSQLGLVLESLVLVVIQ